MGNIELKKREFNEIKLLGSIIDHQPISRANLAKINNLNKTTTSTVVNNLLEEHLVFESGIGSSTLTGGRKPILLEFNPKSALAISIELGESHIQSCLAYLNGEMIQFREELYTEINSETIIDKLIETIDQLLSNAPVTPNNLIGITIGIHGVTLDNRITFSPFYNLEHLDIQQQLQNHYHCPVYLENEANLSAIGEYTFITDKDRIINLNIKTGIGAGVIHFGKLMTGTHGRFGEVGHTILFPGGRECPCGNRGCLERYASAKALYRSIKERMNIDFIEVDELIRLWKAGDPIITEEVLKVIDYLSVGINNLISSYDPDEVIINSALFNHDPCLINELNKRLNSRITKETKLSVSKLTDKAILLGGIAVAASRYLNIENLKLPAVSLQILQENV
ncbi:ROK family protein [Aerococcaceae bacterium WS4759]|uniref:ROK family protein n=1 Tax=Fundicoccus ignavus TaxID=2664442 RepID=A0A6I2GDP3_9LACT|nr:ROK family protein [Fundicoccus ignavus]MRI85927.1 ROK family protein [Fundicoccus ignavus]